MTQNASTHAVVAGYLASLDPRYRPLAAELAEAVLAAAPELEPLIKYGQLCFGLGGGPAGWVCFIDRTKKSVCLRFPRGIWMSDPLGLLRLTGSSLGTIDLDPTLSLDKAAPGGAATIRAYVREAVDRNDAFVQRAKVNKGL